MQVFSFRFAVTKITVFLAIGLALHHWLAANVRILGVFVEDKAAGVGLEVGPAQTYNILHCPARTS